MIPSRILFATKSQFGNFPVPVFGNLTFLSHWSQSIGRVLRPAAPWALPFVAGALWFVWPAVDDDFKIEWGFMKDPTPPPTAPSSDVKLDAAGKKAAENAFKVGHAEHAPSEKEVQIMKEIRKGDFSTLEKDWDAFNLKVRRCRLTVDCPVSLHIPLTTKLPRRLSSRVKMTTMMKRRKKRRRRKKKERRKTRKKKRPKCGKLGPD